MIRFAIVPTWIALFAVSAIPLNAQRPNVVVIYTDDQGSLDANCYGSQDLATPNIDKLAAQGIRFTKCIRRQQFAAHRVLG